jgi:S-adenosylmethionine:diacylglycerol 3-amino-3-carboxypropyl transferase
VTATSTPWEHGRFDARTGPSKVLFGRMYEDAAIECEAFRPGSRVFCIASAGCTAMRLAAAHHDVVAIDINQNQLAYAAARLAGRPAIRGTAERVMAFARTFAPLVGWTRRRLRAFVELEDPVAQEEMWRALDTWRLRVAFGALFSVTALRVVYASPFLSFLPSRLGTVMRARLARCFARHPNRTNPYARALLLGELGEDPVPPPSGSIELVHGDAAAWLETVPAASFDGFTLSNILDGVDAAYRARLFAAVQRAAAPGAVVVLRSFAEPAGKLPTNRAADDRAMLWGIVDVRPAAALST